jgi:hypothetical protein
MAFSIAEPLPFTLLNLPKYAGFMGINPVHFQGAAGTEVFPFMNNACSDLIPQTAWQATGRTSREDIAYAIQDAELEIAQVLGYWPGPFWIAQEVHPYPQHYRFDVWSSGGLDVRLQKIGIQTNFGKIIAPGQRAVTLVGTATTAAGTLAYSDADGDGFDETATITLPTTLTNVCELKVYFADMSGQQEWEIRPARSKSISGGVVTFTFPAWLFIDRDLQAAYPTTDLFQGINLDTTANYVTSVEVYREYNDTTATSSEFFWQPSPQLLNGFCSTCGGSGCVACQLTTQTGCFTIRDAETGVVSPAPASYASGAWSGLCFTVCRNPDEVSLWYKSGKLPNINLRGASCQELDNRMARAIAQYATTKLARPVCSCQAVAERYRWLKEDLSLSGETSFQITEDDLANPFGTQRGAILAWRYIHGVAENVLKGVVV